MDSGMVALSGLAIYWGYVGPGARYEQIYLAAVGIGTPVTVLILHIMGMYRFDSIIRPGENFRPYCAFVFRIVLDPYGHSFPH